MNKKRGNKRGSLLIDHMGEIIMWAVGIAVGIYFIWAYVLHGGGDSVNKLSQCGSLTGNKGECKETCDAVLEAEFADIGCKGVTNKCCIPRDGDTNDVILPLGYGGNNNYDFTVESIELSSSNNLVGCEKDPTDPKGYICNPDNQLSLNFDIVVKNTKTNPIIVYADPVLIINDNGDSIRGPDRYRGKIASPTITTGNEGTASATVTIPSSDARLNYYIKIYPYAVCTTKECKVADSRSRGVMNRNVEDFITLRFIG